MLDSGPLGKLAHHSPKAEILDWHESLKRADIELILPEVADYEVRRSLLLHNLQESIEALDLLRSTISFRPITSSTMLRAAALWADARRRGKPTADLKELDCDVILAAQVLEAGAIVATENVGHLERYVTARDWRKIVVA
jgi:predicted nucleic acid-binding protein